jgi:hypothetical protein
MAEDFRGYLCWTSRNVNDTVVVDAVNSSRAVFLATHRPTPVVRRDFTATSGGSLIDEEQVLAEFLGPNPGLLFAPIIGEAGTGKSHLVRWLQVRVPSDQSRKVVYIPKYETNLRQVIELILAGMAGEAVDGLRRELAEATSSIDERLAPDRLLNELATSIRLRSQGPRPSPPLPNDEYRQWLEIELPKMLYDNVFRERLLAKDGVVDRLVREALHGKQDGDKAEPFAFTEADLPLNVVHAADANKDVRNLYTQLVDSPILREVALELLNDELGAAIRNLFGLGGTRLFDVMLSVRRELLNQETELVLLIEDFTILQGIQRELLDAITEAPKRDGVQWLCPIRVAMAVTSGYFATMAETFSTRGEFAGHVYSLDVPLTHSGGGVLPRDVNDFVSGYLNAARLGQTRLEAALEAAGPERETHRQWVPNACDECGFQTVCHDAFGTSSGKGLYPFNAPSLERAVTARTNMVFDPRRILGSVVRFTLESQADDLHRGEFPSRAFDLQFANHALLPLDPQLAEDIRRADPRDADRRITLLTFWGARPSHIVNLPEGIHDAFAIPPLVDVDVERPVIDEEEPVPPRPPVVDVEALPAAVSRNLVALAQWSTGSTSDLDQNLAAEMRRFLHAAVVEYIDWDAELMRSSDEITGRSNGRFFRLTSFAIERARGGGTRTSSALSIAIPANTESATLFASIVRYQHYGHWRFERGAEALSRLMNRVDAWASDVVAHVRAGGGTSTPWKLVDAAVELLMISARVLDLPGAHSQTNADLIGALLSDPPNQRARRSAEWDRLADACASDNRRLVKDALLNRISARQGGGPTVHAIDVAGVTAALTTFKRTWSLSALPEEAPQEFKRLAEAIGSRLQPGIDAELARLRSWHEATSSALGDAVSAPELAEKVATAASDAFSAGSFAPERLRSEFTETVKAFRKAKYSVVATVGDVLEGAGTTTNVGKLLSDVAADRTRPMDEIAKFVEQSTQILQASRQRAEQQLTTLREGSEGQDALQTLRNTLEQLESVLNEAQQ